MTLLFFLASKIILSQIVYMYQEREKRCDIKFNKFKKIVLVSRVKDLQFCQLFVEATNGRISPSSLINKRIS